MGRSKLSLITVIAFLAFVVFDSIAASAAKTKHADVRLLIDISGSMKQNDPNNLRIPALQLVTNLLPKDSEAGVWAFGRYVNMMVPLAKVDAKWQNNATNTAKRISSSGLFTNIGDVLEKSSYGWFKPDPMEKRSIVLLTDGMVDVSKDAAINVKERKRILTQILPKLKAAGVAIHTIALSSNADHELLKALSSQTDGWYESVNNAEELQKVFLKIFEQATERDSLPIADNQFTVDQSIEEMTVLVFRKNANQPTKLVTPSGQSLEQTANGNGLRWFSTEGYDLITLQKPETGQWSIDADVDPDNRVMVVSQLALSVSELPNNLLAGEAIDYEMKLLEAGKVISNPDFLSLVDARLEQNKDGQKSRMAMFYDASNNSFKQNFFTDSFEGELKLNLVVKSPTFERIRSHAINIYGSPLVVNLEQSPDNVAPHQLHFSIRQDIVQADSLKVTATISLPDGEKIFMGVENLEQPLEITPSLTGGDYSVDFKIVGKSVLGRAFDVNPAAMKFSTQSLLVDDQTQPVTEPEPLAEVVEPVVEKEIAEQAEPEQPSEPIEAEVEVEDSNNWIYWGLGINLLLGLIGFVIWRIIKKRNSKGVSALSDELGIDSEDEDDDKQQDEKQQDENDDDTKKA